MSETPVRFIDLSDIPSGYWRTTKDLIPIKKMTKAHLKKALKVVGKTFSKNRKRYKRSMEWQKLSRYRIFTDEQYYNVIEATNRKRNELLTELRNRK